MPAAFDACCTLERKASSSAVGRQHLVELARALLAQGELVAVGEVARLGLLLLRELVAQRLLAEPGGGDVGLRALELGHRAFPAARLRPGARSHAAR